MSELQQGALLAALATVLGAALGFALSLLERKRAEREAEKRKSAAWSLTNDNGYTWVLTNVGDATASDIELSTSDNCQLNFPTEKFSLQPGEDAPVRVSILINRSENTQLVISWMSHRGEQMGPLRRYLA